jgi:hypothetical protein
MARKYSKKSMKKHSKKHCKKGSRKGSRKGSKKSKKSKKSKRRTPGRVKKDASNPCSLRNKKQCGGDPNCHYVKRRGCTRRRGAATKGQVYEGPMMPADMF